MKRILEVVNKRAITTFSDASNMVFYKRILGDVTTINGYFSAGIFIKKQMAKGVSF